MKKPSKIILKFQINLNNMIQMKKILKIPIKTRESPAFHSTIKAKTSHIAPSIIFPFPWKVYVWVFCRTRVKWYLKIWHIYFFALLAKQKQIFYWCQSHNNCQKKSWFFCGTTMCVWVWASLHLWKFHYAL